MQKSVELLEIRRQSAHLFFGFAIASLLFLQIIDAYFLGGLFFIVLGLSLLSKKTRIPGFYGFLEIFERKKDIRSFPGKGLLFFVLGAFLVAALFSVLIAVASVLILAFGDSMSHIFGRHFGKIKTPFHKKKHIEGSIFGLVLSALAASFFVPFPHAFLASLVAMILEFPTIRIGKIKLDDNLIIPLAAGFTLFLLS